MAIAERLGLAAAQTGPFKVKCCRVQHQSAQAIWSARVAVSETLATLHAQTMRCDAMAIPNSPVPDGLAQMHLILDADLADRLSLMAERRGLELPVFVAWLMTRLDPSAEAE